MYRTILIPLEVSPTDRAIIEHIKPLARMCGSRVVLLHVATGWAARTFGADAVSPEIREDREYLERIREELAANGIPAEAELAYGHPPTEIVKWVERTGCDLIAMSTHGHKLVGEMFLGVTADRVQHAVNVPVLLLRAR